MGIMAVERVLDRPEISVFKRLGGKPYTKNQICSYWAAGRCNRNPCRFLHANPPTSQPKQPRSTWKNPSYCKPKFQTELENRDAEPKVKREEQPQKRISITRGAGSGGRDGEKAQPRQCQHWVSGNCVYGPKCKDIHSGYYGDGFSMLAELEGHEKAITGIALPANSDKLYSSSRDKRVHVWDCHTGQRAGTINLDGEVGCLIAEGPWIFVGLPNRAKAWNIESNVEFCLCGPVGQVHSLVVDNDMLFAGTEDGTIVAWKSNFESSCVQPYALLKGHSKAVVLLVAGRNRLYSGSVDCSIKVWEEESFECLQTLSGHTEAVMSVLCWDSYLLSGSLDKTIKVWAATDSGSLEVVYEFKVDKGVIAFCGIHDADAKPILLCACNDYCVHLYDLPSFNERGRIFSKHEVKAINIGPAGLFFTGDATGKLIVWKLHDKPNRFS